MYDLHVEVWMHSEQLPACILFLTQNMFPLIVFTTVDIEKKRNNFSAFFFLAYHIGVKCGTPTRIARNLVVKI